MRILHCPENVTGNPYYLARAERELGLESRAIAFREHPFHYPIDETLLKPNDSRLKLEFYRWPLLWRALRDFDIIHFNFGSTIMPGAEYIIPERYPAPIRKLYRVYSRILHLRDLPLLRRFGKGIVITYHGDDARQGDYSLDNFEITFASEVEPGYYTPESDAAKRHDITYIARYADQIYALNPDLLHVLPPRAEYIPTVSVDPLDWQPIYRPLENDRTITILHAPSHRQVKGTKYILEAVEWLKAEGISLELILIENMPHAEARRAYETADLVIDQLLAGWYGVLAVELMALGKPVICYIRESDLHFLPKEMRKDLPFINAVPSTIYSVLKEWITIRRNELLERGHRSRGYVERWHDPRKIAARLKITYETILAARQK